MIKNIKLKTLDTTISLMGFVDPASISHLEHMAADKFDTGTLNIPVIKGDQFEGIDMSIPIPTDSVIIIELMNGDEYQMLTDEDIVSPLIIGKNYHSHDIKLIEPLKLLTKINIPGVSITQPKTHGYMKGNVLFETKINNPQTELFVGDTEGKLNFDQTDEQYDNYIYDYNFLNKYNTFKNDQSKGMVIGPTSNMIEIPLDQEIIIPNSDTDHTIHFDMNIFNPQYNIIHKTELHTRINKDYEMYVNFANGGIKYEVIFTLGDNNTPIFSTGTISHPSSTIANRKMIRSRVGVGTYSDGIGNETIFNVNYNTYVPGDTNTKKLEFFNIDTSDEFIPSRNYHAAIIDNYDLYNMRTFKIKPGQHGKLKAFIRHIGYNSRWNISGYRYSCGLWSECVPRGNEINIYKHKKFMINDFNVRIFEGSTTKTLSTEINRILNIVDDHDIELMENNEIFSDSSPELTFDKNNLYEVIKTFGDYMGAIPKLTFDYTDKLKWVPATEQEYNAGFKKISINTTSESFMNFLNILYKNEELGTTAIRANDEEYEFVETTSSVYNSRPEKITIYGSAGWNGTNIMNHIKIHHPQYYDNLSLYPGVLGVMVDIDGQYATYWEVVFNDQNRYAKLEVISSQDGRKIIKYDFYNELDFETISEPDNIQNIVLSRDTENYISSIEMNVENLINEDNIVNTGWMKLNGLSDGQFKIDTDNLGLKLPNGPIYKITKVEGMIGRLIDMPSGTSNISSTKIFDLTDYIIEEAYFNILENKSEYTTSERSSENTKNQHLYYKQGDDIIYNMSFTGTQPPVHPNQPNTSSNRAIYEMFAKAILLETGKDTANMIIDTGEVSDDMKIRLRFEYIPYTSTRTNIYKDDQSGFEQKTSKYYNEQQKLNDPTTLGRKAQQDINRMGNTYEELNGSTTDINRIPKLGTLNKKDGRILVSLNKIFLPNRIDFTGTYIKDYSNINEYFGIDSNYRQYEIPKEDIVNRIEKKETHVYITDIPIENNINEFQHGNLFNGLTTINSIPENQPKYALIETWDSKDILLTAVVKPVNSQVMGKGISHFFIMDDNYSAGNKITTKTENGIISYYQQSIEYSDSFGSISKIRVRFLTMTDSDYLYCLNNYSNFPYIGSNTNTLLFRANIISSYTYELDKDARERIGFNQDIKFFSDKQDKIKIYEGFARYNPLNISDNDSIDIRVGILKRSISRSTNKIEIGNIIYSSSNILEPIGDNRLKININGTGEQLVIYEHNTLEPILTYRPGEYITPVKELNLYYFKK